MPISACACKIHTFILNTQMHTYILLCTLMVS